MKLWRRPFDQGKHKVPRGEVYILKDRCKGCGFCVEYCPKDVLVMSEEFNRYGYHPPRVSTAENCVECHLCEMLCPEFAIYVIKQEEEKSACAGVKEGEK
jgi:2-oxoglutarate ferredoxin oxidoreductase subunit delta